MKKILVPLVLILLVAVGVYASGPFLALGEVKAAMAAGDEERLAGSVDFPSLQTNLKTRAEAGVTREAEARLGGGLLGEIGARLGSSMAGELIEILVTPEGIADFMLTLREASPEETEYSFRDPSYGFASPGRFVVTAETESGERAGVALERRGLGWKITDLVGVLEPEED